MKLFAYYALHSLKNQLKKIFKTWVFIFMAVCILLGVVVGVGAATLSNLAESQDPESGESQSEESEGMDPEMAMGLIELVAGGVILAVFAFEALSADKNGSRIFQPADVNLLFASPLQPQSVLMFKLATQMGTAILASVYLLFQLPNLTLNLGLSLWAALSMILTWCLTVMLGKLLQILLYMLCGAHPGLRKQLRRVVYALLALIAAAYYVYWRRSGTDALEAAAGFFNGGVSRWIPLWGWLKGFLIFAVRGETLPCLACLGGILAGGAALVLVIRRTKADFYEDALAKSEEMAEILEQARADQSGRVGMRKRKKDRDDRLRRDGMRRGSGANVFFFKTLYNRFRFAHFGFLTKTTETYLVAAAAVSVLCRFILKTDGLIPAALTLAGLAFFRALGNPLEQDTKMGYFVMIPESTWAKLFWSLLGSSVNCLLDALPALLLAAVLLGVNPLPALGWLPFIVSVDFFSTTVGAFIALSVPVSAGKNIKQVVQIMFVYFGLLPDIAIMAVGLILERATAAAVAAAAVNLALGFLFFSLSPLFIDPRDKKPRTPERVAGAEELRSARRQFSRLGWGVFTILAVATALQLGAATLLGRLSPEWGGRPWVLWLCTFAPLYLAAVPVGLLILRRAPARRPQSRPLGAGTLISAGLICVFLMYAGNLLGAGIMTALQGLTDAAAQNPLLTYAMDQSLLPKILFMVVLAPLIEEYIFRRQLIDRMNVYGGKLAVLVSAVMFGAFHGNLSQMFYAFAIGLALGCVYLRTGRLRYCVGLHMFLNLLGSVVAPAILSRVELPTQDMAALSAQELLKAVFTPGLLALLAYILLLLALSLAGLVLLCMQARRLRFEPAERELPRRGRFRTVWLNSGMLALLALCAALVAVSFLA